MSENILSLALRISRIRFWIYTGGTYVVGFALGMGSWEAFLRPEYMIYLFYFFIPANIFIYGVNDYFDQETDKNNPKKDAQEYRLEKKDEKGLFSLLAVVTGISLILLATQADLTAQLIFASFLFLSFFYSAPPLRFKEIPGIDFASNMLYIMPGIFGYYLASGFLPPWFLILAGFFHIAAMHLFSAIPDIGYDTKAGLRTTAVTLGERPSLILCLLFWTGLSMIVIPASGIHPAAFLVLIYPAVPLLLLLKRDHDIEKVYWYLPAINTTLGGLIFIAATLHTFG
ncbi:4-hydroxybenzoate polyprenyltransferase [Methanocalculus alkaliphilus]|uniref:prenyltransferase n=1 Tax=Methanocalculus alkaliphilus TaxID=768730 RepID=UPI00209D1758|nr:prenyltransferase [Methanocalculus alkaliphilus]MCP1714965.1 4-hydroxybenzoate polyprenyltransferase [Methanocalculus alkaliphilus]